MMYYDPGDVIQLIPPEEKARLPGPQRRGIESIQTHLALAQIEARNGFGEGVERSIHSAVARASWVLEENFLKDPADFLKNIAAEADKVSDYVAVMPDRYAKKIILQNFELLNAMREQVAQQQHAVLECVP